MRGFWLLLVCALMLACGPMLAAGQDRAAQEDAPFAPSQENPRTLLEQAEMDYRAGGVCSRCSGMARLARDQHRCSRRIQPRQLCLPPWRLRACTVALRTRGARQAGRCADRLQSRARTSPSGIGRRSGPGFRRIGRGMASTAEPPRVLGLGAWAAALWTGAGLVGAAAAGDRGARPRLARGARGRCGAAHGHPAPGRAQPARDHPRAEDACPRRAARRARAARLGWAPASASRCWSRAPRGCGSAAGVFRAGSSEGGPGATELSVMRGSHARSELLLAGC
jgi:hypothetical protein